MLRRGWHVSPLPLSQRQRSLTRSYFTRRDLQLLSHEASPSEPGEGLIVQNEGTLKHCSTSVFSRSLHFYHPLLMIAVEYQPKSSCSIQGPVSSSWLDGCNSIRTGNGLTKPEASKTSLEDGVEGGSVNPHCGDEGLVFMVLIEMYPYVPIQVLGSKFVCSR